MVSTEYDKYLSRNHNSISTTLKDKHKMFTKLKKLVQQVFAKNTQQTLLEQYIVSKRPTCTADLEQLVLNYERSLRGTRHGF
jgi:hypothetical protein